MSQYYSKAEFSRQEGRNSSFLCINFLTRGVLVLQSADTPTTKKKESEKEELF